MSDRPALSVQARSETAAAPEDLPLKLVPLISSFAKGQGAALAVLYISALVTSQLHRNPAFWPLAAVFAWTAFSLVVNTSLQQRLRRSPTPKERWAVAGMCAGATLVIAALGASLYGLSTLTYTLYAQEAVSGAPLTVSVSQAVLGAVGVAVAAGGAARLAVTSVVRKAVSRLMG